METPLQLWAGTVTTREFGQRRDRVYHYVICATNAEAARTALIEDTKWRAQHGSYSAVVDPRPHTRAVHQVGTVEFKLNPKRRPRA